MASSQTKELWRSTCTRQCALFLIMFGIAISHLMFGIVISYRSRLEYRRCSQQLPGAQLPSIPVRALPGMKRYNCKPFAYLPAGIVMAGLVCTSRRARPTGRDTGLVGENQEASP